MAKRAAQECTLLWKGTVGIENADSLKKELLDAFEKNQPVSLDISAVEDIDTSVLQIILAAKKEAEARKIPFSLDPHISDAILKIMQLVNLPFPLKESAEADYV